MMIYPTIELQNGRCVSLRRGRLDEPEIWHVDPVERAARFGEAGAEWIHITDFDGVAGEDTNRDLLIEMIQTAKVPVQLGGGFKSLDGISEWIDLGVGRIVLSSVATVNPQLVKQAAKLYPDQIVLAVDVYQGAVMSGGWRHKTSFKPDEFIDSYNDDPLAAVIVTDIDADIDEHLATLSLITWLADCARAPVIARGTIRTLDDLSRIKYVPKVSGAIIGRALFDRSIDLGEALALARTPAGRVAEFL